MCEIYVSINYLIQEGISLAGPRVIKLLFHSSAVTNDRNSPEVVMDHGQSPRDRGGRGSRYTCHNNLTRTALGNMEIMELWIGYVFLGRLMTKYWH